jgi:hypothetical protein
LKKLSQKSLPSSLFEREESFWAIHTEKFSLFPLWKRGKKGDFMALKETTLIRCSLPER